MATNFLPYGIQAIDDADVTAVSHALRGEYLTTGPRVASFERAFAESCGVPHAVACANGTAALHMAALVLDIGPGDVVLAPTMSFLASANGMHYAGAEIVFMDCDPETGLVTPETFSDAIARAPRAPKAAVLVHLNGNVCDMEALAAIAERHRITFVEDACHAIGGSSINSAGVSSAVGACAYSAMSTFSLHPVKTITMGEGGVVTTRDLQIAARLVRVRSHGMNRDAVDMQHPDMAFDNAGLINPWYYEMPELGYNYRATDFQCAMGESQLSKLPMFATRRRELQSVYDDLFAQTTQITPVSTPVGVEPVLHLYALRIRFGQDGLPQRGDVMRALRARGIGTMVHYIPIHRQPYYARLYPGLSLPGADAYYEQALSIPFYPAMNRADAERVVTEIVAVLNGR